MKPASAAAPTQPIIASANLEDQKRIRTLRKKLHDIEVLEARLEAGGLLQQNQKDKVATKGDVVAALNALTSAEVDEVTASLGALTTTAPPPTAEAPMEAAPPQSPEAEMIKVNDPSTPDTFELLCSPTKMMH